MSLMKSHIFKQIKNIILFQRHNPFLILCPLLLLYSSTAAAVDPIPKLVYLVFDEDRIIASNIEFSRFDEIRLAAKEKVSDSAVGNAVIVVVTNNRIMGYSVKKLRWVTKPTLANEKLESISVEDYSALVRTSKRFLNFNGISGVWAEKSRRKVFN
ncbi:MAG: hypothetical protein HKM94_02340 [Halobacteria archaeon]|nr:hypothetical protein [Halobacteria archaeon]